MTVDCAEIYWR